VLSARSKKQQGDLRGAESDFKKALEVYPKYFWADRQQREVQQTLSSGEPEAQDLARIDFSIPGSANRGRRRLAAI